MLLHWLSLFNHIYRKPSFNMKAKITKKEIQEIIREELRNIRLDEDLLGWMSGIGRKIAYDIIDRRARGITSALSYDPKLASLAKDLRMTTKDLEDRISTLASRDTDFLRALATQRVKRL